MSFNKVISSLSHNQILLVWKSIHTFLTDTKPGLVNGSGVYWYMPNWGTVINTSRFYVELKTSTNIIDLLTLAACFLIFPDCISDKFGGCSEVRSAILWLYSCILMASPIMQAITVAGFAPSIADMMKRSALEVVKPFVESMLTLPHVRSPHWELVVLRVPILHAFLYFAFDCLSLSCFLVLKNNWSQW